MNTRRNPLRKRLLPKPQNSTRGVIPTMKVHQLSVITVIPLPYCGVRDRALQLFVSDLSNQKESLKKLLTTCAGLSGFFAIDEYRLNDCLMHADEETLAGKIRVAQKGLKENPVVINRAQILPVEVSVEYDGHVNARMADLTRSSLVDALQRYIGEFFAVLTRVTLDSYQPPAEILPARSLQWSDFAYASNEVDALCEYYDLRLGNLLKV